MKNQLMRLPIMILIVIVTGIMLVGSLPVVQADTVVSPYVATIQVGIGNSTMTWQDTWVNYTYSESSKYLSYHPGSYLKLDPHNTTVSIIIAKTVWDDYTEWRLTTHLDVGVISYQAYDNATAEDTDRSNQLKELHWHSDLHGQTPISIGNESFAEYIFTIQHRNEGGSYETEKIIVLDIFNEAEIVIDEEGNVIPLPVGELDTITSLVMQVVWLITLFLPGIILNAFIPRIGFVAGLTIMSVALWITGVMPVWVFTVCMIAVVLTVFQGDDDG
jgi:hypothetical protein